MPAVLLAALGWLAGVVAGLLSGWAPWTLAPLAAAGAFLLLFHRRQAAVNSHRLLSTVDYRLPTSLAIALTAAAAGIIWGGAALRVRASDCRLRWRDGVRVALVAEPRDLAPRGDAASRARRYDVREPAVCRGPVLVQLPRADTSDAVLVLVGTWRADPSFGDTPLPRRAEWAGKLVATVARPVGARPGLRTRLRVGAERALMRLFGPRRWPLAAALTVSPEAALPVELRQRFARAGLAHILSISGLHVGILAGALIILLRAGRLSPPVARLAGTVLVAGYIWMLGFPAPALRSGGLLALWCWSRARQRPPVPGTILAGTALVVVAADPWTVFEPGPWLSFAGVWGCGSASRWWERVAREARGRGVRRVLRWLTPLVVSAGAVLATSPIQALAFGSVTPVAVAANIAAIPLAAFATPALALALVLAAIPGAMPAAALAASASGLALDGLEQVASLAAALPSATFTVEAPFAWAAVTGALAIWLLHPARGRRPARQLLAHRVVSAALVLLAGLAWWPVLGARSAPDGDGRLALHFLSVGQGDAAAIRTPHGRWIVIDGGPRAPGLDAGARKVVPFLRRHGARRVDVVVASHGDADHLGGIPAVLTLLPAELVLEPGAVDGRPLYAELLADIAKDHARWHPARAGERFAIDGVTIRIWHPDSATIAARWAANENSVVLTVEYGAFRALFGGDAGLPMEALRAGTIGAVTVLKVGHHGSRSASGEAWLEDLKPVVCIIEVGARNTYGHPDPGTVARLRDRGCGVWRTDRDGDVDVSTDGRMVWVRAAARDTVLALGAARP